MSDAPQILLAIDTSGPRLQLALAAGGMTDVHAEDLPKGHAELLFGRIAALLARHHLTYADLTRLAVTTGPGSFTGLRIGIAAARGLALARTLPVIGVPNLLALSLGVTDGPVDVILDARRGECYLQCFSAPGVPLDKARLVPEAETNAYPRQGATLVSDSRVDMARLCRFALGADPGRFPPDPAYVRAADAKPQAQVLARLEPAR